MSEGPVAIESESRAPQRRAAIAERVGLNGSLLGGELLGGLVLLFLVALPFMVSFAFRALFPGQAEDIYGLAFGLTALAEMLAAGLVVLACAAIVLWRLLWGD